MSDSSSDPDIVMYFSPDEPTLDGTNWQTIQCISIPVTRTVDVLVVSCGSIVEKGKQSVIPSHISAGD